MDAAISVGSLTYFIRAVAVLAVVYLVKHFTGIIRIFILGNKLPGPRGWPIVGSALEFSNPNLDVLDRIWKYNKEYGLFKAWLGPMLNVFICTAEDAEIYYSSAALLDRSEHFEFLKPFIGNGLVTANGAHWKRCKKLMEPSLRYSSLRSFMPIFLEKTETLVSILEKEVGKSSFSIYDYVKKWSFDIITGAMCDLEMNSQIQNVKILEDADVAMKYMTSRMHSIWQQNDFIYSFSEMGKDFFRKCKNVKEFVDEVIATKKKVLSGNKQTSKRNGNEDDDEDFKLKPFLQRLIEQEEMNDEEMRDQVTTMVATGFETSTSASCFVLVLLGIHQDVQEKLYQEISSALQNGLHDKELARLKYLDKVIKESLRIFSIAPILFRKAKEDVQFGKYLVPKGAAIGINIFAIHRNPKYYKNPDIFNPENFSVENVASRHPFAFIPFGMGVRRCIGEKLALMAIRIIITKILLKYKIECDMKMEDIPIRLGITLKMTNGFPIRLLKR